MRFSKHCLGVFMAACVIVTAACDNTHVINLDFLAPTPQPYRAWGLVDEDSCFLPDTGARCLPVAGVRIEVLEGTDKGRFAISGPDGRFDLGMLTSVPASCVMCREPLVGVSASKEGWVTDVEGVGSGGYSSLSFRISQ